MFLEIHACLQPAPRKGIQDSLGFWIPHRGFRIPSTRLRISIVSGIPDSMSCIPDSKAQVSGFHKQKLPLLTRCPKQNFLDPASKSLIHGAITVPQRALGKIGISSSVRNHSVWFYLVELWQTTRLTSSDESAIILLTCSNDTSTIDLWFHSRIWSPLNNTTKLVSIPSVNRMYFFTYKSALIKGRKFYSPCLFPTVF